MTHPSTDWHLVSLEAAAPQPWRNGRGTTRELLTWPGGGVWTIRASVADVTAAGPFSRFEGIERWFAVLEGDGVELRLDGTVLALDVQAPPLQFDGGNPVDCALLGGPTLDFNLMVQPGTATMRRVSGRHPFRSDGPAVLAVYAHDRPATLTVGDQVLQVPPRHLLWSHRNGRSHGHLQARGALWLEVRTA